MTNQTSKRRFNPLTASRKRKFLTTLAATGSPTAAARAASGPHVKPPHFGLQTFYDECRRDPVFAQALESAKAEALAKVESEIMRRGVDGYQRPIYQKGVLVGHERVYSDNLLVRIAERLAPDDWSRRQKHEHTGTIQHHHGHVMLSIVPEDVLLLPPKRQKELVGLLEQISNAKEENEQ